MGQETITKILLRRGTDADRQSVVLAAGEPGWTTDTNKLYIGDGSTPGGVEVSAASADLVTGFEHLSANNLYAYTDSDIKVHSDLVITKPGTYNSIEIGKDQTGDNYAYIDLVGDTTYTDFGLRLIRNNTGANANSSLRHRGTGELDLVTVDQGDIRFITDNGNVRMMIDASNGGKVGIGTTTPNHELTVVGDISATGTIHGNAIQSSAAGDTWTFLGSPVDLSFDPAESIVVSSGGNAGKLLATSGLYDNTDYRIVPIAGLHGVPSNAKYVMCHVYVGQADFYGIDPHVGTAQPIGFNPHLNTSNNNNTRGNIVLGIGAVPFPRLSNSTGDPGIGNATNATLSVDGGLTGGVSEVYYPSSQIAQGMSRSDSIVFIVIDQDSDGTGVLHTLRILAYK